MPKKLSSRTFIFENAPKIISSAAAAGKKESEGPLCAEFDFITKDDKLGQRSFERAEGVLQRTALLAALKKRSISPRELDCVFAGDLLNQCIGSSFGLMDLSVPFLGLYGACSTMALSLICAAVFVDGGYANSAAAVTSSHFCSAERQYRFPLEYGCVRPPTSQWTVTAAGAAIVGHGEGPILHGATVGVIQDLGVKDANNMGAAMAPAAYDAISAHLSDTGTSPSDYDAIFTGDLGLVGSRLLYDLFSRDGVDISPVHRDCGLMIYDIKKQDVHSGGSGCGCSASVLCSHIMNRLRDGRLKNIIFCATGALLSPTSTKQRENIPVIAHAVNIRSERI